MATQREIKGAVFKGTAWLKSKQNNDGSYGNWNLGSTCLAVIALLHSNVPNTDPAVANAVSYILNSTPPKSTYFRALTIMALVANGQKLSQSLNRVQADKKWLIQTQCKTTDNKLSYGGWGSFDYSKNTDGSNTQFALLALYAATIWGFSVPQESWFMALIWYQNNHIVNNDGSFVYKPWDISNFKNNPSTYCMTSAALSGLKIINFFTKEKGLIEQTKKLLDSALNWLDTNYSIELQMSSQDDWHCYYLYSMASGCVISPYTELIGTHDWYAEMSTYLVMQQKDDGSWISTTDNKSTKIKDTVFALLALGKVSIADQTRINYELDVTWGFMANISCGIIKMDRHTICFRTK